MIKIKSAEFVTSIADIKVYESFSKTYDCDEICVVGRSNVGKSSFINLITGKNLAKTSSTPGRTRLINIFKVNDGEFMLVDLPGYGYAKAGKTEIEKWGSLTTGYLGKSEKLKHIFSLIDCRHEPSDGDKRMLNYMYHYGFPFTIVATKTDKLSKAQLGQKLQTIASRLMVGRDNIIPVSAFSKTGKDKIESRLAEIFSI